jgi:hypothetical protein
MRRTLLTLALALPLVTACASGGGGGMRPRYDSAAGQTNLEQLILQTSGGGSDAAPMRVTARYSWRGQGTPAPAPHAYLSFDAWPQGTAWPWRSDNQLQVTVDGQRARYNGRYDSETQEGRRHENVTYQIPIGDLAVIAEAGRIEGRIGPRSFTLEAADLARLREFVTYIRGGTQP